MDNTIRKDVIQVAVLFKNEMVKAGKGFKFAKAKDITKTYHYRWFKSFLDKCYNNGLDLDCAMEVCRSIVKYAKRRNMLNSGASLLSRSDIIDICIDKLERDISEYNDDIEIIKLFSKIIDVDDPFKMFMRKNNRHSDHNIIVLRNNGKIDDSVISISKSCMRAILSINDSSLPSVKDYFIIKARMKNKYGDDLLRSILGDDYNG